MLDIGKIRHEINIICFNYNMEIIPLIIKDTDESAYRWCMDELPSFDAMLYQFWRPLILEEWIPKDKLDRLLGNGVK